MKRSEMSIGLIGYLLQGASYCLHPEKNSLFESLQLKLIRQNPKISANN